MRHLKHLALFLTLTGALLLPLGCDNDIDCFQICSDYSECVDEIDVTDCTVVCEDDADANDIDDAAADNCEVCTDAANACDEVRACFDGAACQEAIFVAAE